MKEELDSLKRFSFMEAAVIIGIIATIFVFVFVVIDPAEKLAERRNSKRREDTLEILDAIHSYIVVNDGALPEGLSIAMQEKEIGSCRVGEGTCGGTQGCVDLSGLLEEYIERIPKDPKEAIDTATGYRIYVENDKTIVVTSCHAELGENISSFR